MTSPERSLPLRILLDTGVYVSAAISATGPPRKLVEAAVAGHVRLVVSPLLLAELRGVLGRPKLRSRLSPDAADALVDAVMLVAEHVDDPSREGRVPVCRDPADEYLVALAEEARPDLLVSGDKDLLAVKRGGVVVRTPADALDMLDFRHPWGAHLLPGRDEDAWLQAKAEGHAHVLSAAQAFVRCAIDPGAIDVLPDLVTPESLSDWQRSLPDARADLAGRGMTNRPEYPTPDTAYVKLPPDPGVHVRATRDVPLTGAIILTMQRRPELWHPPGTGGWRAHAAGDYFPIEGMPSPAHPEG